MSKFISKIDTALLDKETAKSYKKKLRAELKRLAALGEKTEVVLVSEFQFACKTVGAMLLIGNLAGETLKYYNQNAKKRKERDYGIGVCEYRPASKEESSMAETSESDGDDEDEDDKKGGKKTLFIDIGAGPVKPKELLKGLKSIKLGVPAVVTKKEGEAQKENKNEENNSPVQEENLSAEEVLFLQKNALSDMIQPKNLKGLQGLVSFMDSSDFAKLVQDFQALAKIKDANLQMATFMTLRARTLEWIDKHKTDSSSNVKKRSQALQEYLSQFEAATQAGKQAINPIKPDTQFDVKDLKGATTFMGSGFNDVVKSIEEFNGIKNTELKYSRALRLTDIIQDWLEKHKDDKSKDGQKRRSLLENFLKNQLQKLIGQQSHASRQFKNTDTKIVNAHSGSTQASDAVQDVLDAGEEERAAKIAALLQLGKGKNDDATFGALMKWLGAKLDAPYTRATQRQFGKPSQLIVDINSVFGAGSLRTRYLFDIIAGKTDPFASLALSLGLLGKTWFKTAEDGDFLEKLQKDFSAAQIDKMMAATDIATYEGAIAKHIKGRFSNSLKNKVEAETRKKKEEEQLDKLRKDGSTKALQDLDKANQQFLASLVKDMEQDSKLGRVDADKLIQQILAWADGAGADEITAVLSGDEKSFWGKLQKMTGSFSVSGFTDKDFAYLKGRLVTIRDTKLGKFTDKASGEMMSKINGVLEKRKISKYRAFKEKLHMEQKAGEEILETLFDSDVKDFPLAIIEQNTGFSEDYKQITKELESTPTFSLELVEKYHPDHRQAALEYQSLDKQIQGMESSDPKRQKLKERRREIEEETSQARLNTLNSERDDMLSAAMQSFQSKLSDCGVTPGRIKDITEFITSNGAKGKTYRILVKMATTAMPQYDLGAEVFKLLKEVEPGSPEYAAIQNDKDLLLALKQRVTRTFGLGTIKILESNKQAWKNIATYLQLSGKIANPDDRSDALQGINTLNKERQAVLDIRNTRPKRSQVPDPKVAEEQAEKSKELKTKPDFWAAQLSDEYRGDNSTSAMARIILAANNNNLSAEDVMEALQEIDKAAYDFISKKAKKKEDSGDDEELIEALKGGDGLTGLVLLQRQAQKGGNVFSKRRVKHVELKKIVDATSLTELVSEWFDFDGFKTALAERNKGLEFLKRPNLPADAKAKAQKQLAKLETRLRRFDLTADVKKMIADTSSNKNALDLMQQIRGRVVEALSENGENEVKQLFLDQGVKEADIKLLAQRIEASSKMEREVALEEGAQWSGVTSRMLNRDEAVAAFNRQNWAVSEKLVAISNMSEEEQEEEKNNISDSLEQAMENMQQAQDKFEESKNRYNGYVKTAIGLLVQAAITAATLASGVGAARGVVELLWSLGASVFKNAVNGAVSKYLEGGQTNREFWSNFLVEQLAKSAKLVAGQYLGIAMSNIKMDGVAEYLTQSQNIKGFETGEGWFIAKESDIAYELFDVGDLLGMEAVDFISKKLPLVANGQEKVDDSEPSLFGNMVFDLIIDTGLDEGLMEPFQEQLVALSDGNLEASRALFLAKQMDID